MRQAGFVAAAMTIWVTTGLVPILAAEPETDPTVLSLRETASAPVAPDELMVSLRAEAEGAAPREVQASVNRRMADALAQARGEGGLKISTGSYVVYQQSRRDGAGPDETRWVARQSLTLSAPMAASASLLDLARRLQDSGLLMQDMHGEVGEALREDTQTRLTREALGRVRAQAQAAAEAMGLRVVGYRSLRIDKGGEPVRPLGRAMVMAAAVPAPSAQPADQQIDVTAEAEALLRP